MKKIILAGLILFGLLLTGCVTECPTCECYNEPCSGELLIVEIPYQDLEARCNYYNLGTGQSETINESFTIASSSDRMNYIAGSKVIAYTEFYVQHNKRTPKEQYLEDDVRCRIYDSFKFTVTASGHTYEDSYRFEYENLEYGGEMAIIDYLKDTLQRGDQW